MDPTSLIIEAMADAAVGGPLAGMLGGNAMAGNVTASAIGGILIPLIAGFFKRPAA